MFAGTHSETRAFERYVLSDKKLDEALKMLVGGSDAYHYLRFMHILNEKGQFTLEEKKAFDEFLKNSSGAVNDLELRLLLLSYDSETDPEKKNRLLDKLARNYLSLRFEDSRPQDLSTTAAPVHQGDISNIPLDKVDLHEELKTLYSQETDAYAFTKYALVNVDFSKVEPLYIASIIDQLKGEIAQLDSKDFFKLYAVEFKEHFKPGEHHWGSLLHWLTIQQLDKLKEFVPQVMEDVQFVGKYMQKKFKSELEEKQDNTSPKERRVNLIRLYEFASLYPKCTAGLRGNLLLEILNNGLEVDLFEEKYFNEYLKTPLRTVYCKKHAESSGGEWGSYIQSIQSREYKSGLGEANKKDRELLTAYLDKMFKTGKTVANYLEFFNHEFLIEV